MRPDHFNIFRVRCHFQAGQQFNVAGRTVNVCLADANGFVLGVEFDPLLLRLIARVGFVCGGSIHDGLGATFRSALSGNIKLRHAIRDFGDGKCSQDYDWEVYEHFCSRDVASNKANIS
jgi:hypothetical protein